MAPLAKLDNAAIRLGRLSAGGLKIAKLVISGALNRDIAEQLGIAMRTVKPHRMHMMQKLQVGNIIELARTRFPDHGSPDSGLWRSGRQFRAVFL